MRCAPRRPSATPEAGLFVLEVRRSGRLAGLFRTRGRVRIDEDIAALLARIEHRRAIEGGVLRGLELGPVSTPETAAHLRDELAQLTSDAFAELYDPEVLDVVELLQHVPDHVEVLVVDQIDPADPTEVVCVATHNRQPAEVVTAHLTAETVELLRLLSSDDPERDIDRAHVRPGHLSGLSEVVPPRLRRRLENGLVDSLLLVPSGLLWSVPWAAVPFGGHRLLVDLTSVTVTPSLRAW